MTSSSPHSDAAPDSAGHDSAHPDAAPDGASVPTPDQTERVILQAAADEGGTGRPGDILVVGDATGALTTAALELVADHETARVWSWSTSRAEVRALAALLPGPISSGRLVLPQGSDPAPLEEFAAAASVHLVLARLPKSLAALEDLARHLARLAERSDRADRTDLTLVAGGRVKHMTRSQNEVLGAFFGEVRASRGLGKSRALIASEPRAEVAAPEPATGTAHVAVRGTGRELALRGVGGVFGGARPDAGSLLLLESLDRALAAGELDAVTSTVDLGCGNGLLTAHLAAALPEARVLGSDDDLDAVASTRATLEASDLEREGVLVSWDDALSDVAEDSADLVLLNPPFHDGPGIDATLVRGLLDAAARVLRPGGQLWFVHNSHLRYRPELEARVGTVRQRARDRRFTVLSAVAR